MPLLLRRFSLLLLILPAILPRATGQTFQPSPAPLVSQEVELNQANEVYLHFDNPSGDTLRLKWRQLEISMPDDWDIDLCDYGTCYIGIPSNGNMNAVYDTIRPYLKLIVQPGITPGAAWCWFRVQEVNHPDNFQDVYFSLFTSGITATQTAVPASIRVFPNPAHEVLIVENPNAQAMPGRLFDSTGRLVWQENLTPGTQTRIPLTNWPTGLYFFQTDRESQPIIIK